SVRIIDLIFDYSIDQKDMVRAWEKSLKENCDKDCKVSYKSFLSKVGAVKTGDKHRYVFEPKKFRMQVSGAWYEFNDVGLSDLILNTYIGKAPPTEDLKKALLGQ
ncbi:MAG: hypothetical protein AAF203_09575, partial [Pseudomonadota bacterium]